MVVSWLYRFYSLYSPYQSKKRESASSLMRSLFSEPLVGFEPTTPRLQITCSGQLS